MRAYIDQIHQRGGRAWLYVQATADESPNLPRPYTRLSYDHVISGRTLFHCYYPDSKWAERICDIWAPFALYLKFDGIHWDQMGRHCGALNDDTVYSTFLRATKGILEQHKLLQTTNCVDGFGWDASLVHEGIIEFPYWEVRNRAKARRPQQPAHTRRPH